MGVCILTVQVLDFFKKQRYFWRKIIRLEGQNHVLYWLLLLHVDGAATRYYQLLQFFSHQSRIMTKVFVTVRSGGVVNLCIGTSVISIMELMLTALRIPIYEIMQIAKGVWRRYKRSKLPQLSNNKKQMWIKIIFIKFFLTITLSLLPKIVPQELIYL